MKKHTESKKTERTISVYEMLGISDTSSDEELQTAYQKEKDKLHSIQPQNVLEELLLKSKTDELSQAMKRAETKSIHHHIQSQYQKRKEIAVRLYSFFPVGLIGLILRFFNISIGQDGWCDSLCKSCFSCLDQNCCRCSCCGDCCCFTGIYTTIISNTICCCPTKCDNCYENTSVVRFADLGLSIFAIVWWIISLIRQSKERKRREMELEQERQRVKTVINEIEAGLQRKRVLMEQIKNEYRELQKIEIDIRPFTLFLSKLPGITFCFTSMADRINEPDSFYDKLLDKYQILQANCNEIRQLDVDLRQSVKSLEGNTFASESKSFQGMVSEIQKPLESDEEFKRASQYVLKW